MKALILDNKVVDVAEVEFEVHSTMTWMDCTSECKTGWLLVDSALASPESLLTDAEIAANAQAVINGDSLAYLASTDWYITRFTESGVVVPADVTQARTAARLAII